jgi:hypothetical protein
VPGTVRSAEAKLKQVSRKPFFIGSTKPPAALDPHCSQIPLVGISSVRGAAVFRNQPLSSARFCRTNVEALGNPLTDDPDAFWGRDKEIGYPPIPWSRRPPRGLVGCSCATQTRAVFTTLIWRQSFLAWSGPGVGLTVV